MIKRHTVYIMYSQLAVFQADLKKPFNNWTSNHVLQGFSWRPESVSFRMLEEEGDVKVTFRLEDTFKRLEADTVRSIRTPFRTMNGLIEIASISDGFKAEIPPGDYSLYFETGKKGKSMWCMLTFVRKHDSQPEILICDDELHPDFPLLMEAEPAT